MQASRHPNFHNILPHQQWKCPGLKSKRRYTIKGQIIHFSILSLVDENVCTLHIKSSTISFEIKKYISSIFRDLSFKKGITVMYIFKQNANSIETKMLLASDFKGKIWMTSFRIFSKQNYRERRWSGRSFHHGRLLLARDYDLFLYVASLVLSTNSYRVAPRWPPIWIASESRTTDARPWVLGNGYEGDDLTVRVSIYLRRPFPKEPSTSSGGSTANYGTR